MTEQELQAILEENRRLREAFDRKDEVHNALNRDYVQVRNRLNDANSRIEQLEDILSAIKDYAASYAEFNPTYENIVKMCEEGEGNEV